MLGWAAAERPLVLLMEDVHLADVASLELAGYVGRRLPELPVLMILTRRDAPRRAEADVLRQGLAGRGALLAELELGPLGEHSLAALVRSVANLPDDEVGRVVAASEGNALLAVEVARASRGGATVPAALAPLVRAATGRLAPEARAVAELIAVAGRELARDELLRLPVAQPAAAAAAALESGVLVAREGRLGFRHALLRAAAYDDLSEPRRAELHDQLAAALQGAGLAPDAEIGRASAPRRARRGRGRAPRARGDRGAPGRRARGSRRLPRRGARDPPRRSAAAARTRRRRGLAQPLGGRRCRVRAGAARARAR